MYLRWTVDFRTNISLPARRHQSQQSLSPWTIGSHFQRDGLSHGERMGGYKMHARVSYFGQRIQTGEVRDFSTLFSWQFISCPEIDGCNFLRSYVNCSLTKYTEKHKIKTDSRAFQLVSLLGYLRMLSWCRENRYCCGLVVQAAADGSDQEVYFGGSDEGSLFSGRSTSNCRVRTILRESQTHINEFFFIAVCFREALFLMRKESLYRMKKKKKTPTKCVWKTWC